jgi:hypothetical protein
MKSDYHVRRSDHPIPFLESGGGPLALCQQLASKCLDCMVYDNKEVLRIGKLGEYQIYYRFICCILG